MTTELKTFGIKLGILTIIVAFLGGIFFYFQPQYYLNILPFLLFYVSLLTFGVYYAVLKGLNKSTIRSFNTYFTGANGIKLLLFILFLAIYLFLKSENALIFSINFLILYVIYTAFEVSQLVKLVKKMSKNT